MVIRLNQNYWLKILSVCMVFFYGFSIDPSHGISVSEQDLSNTPPFSVPYVIELDPSLFGYYKIEYFPVVDQDTDTGENIYPIEVELDIFFTEVKNKGVKDNALAFASAYYLKRKQIDRSLDYAYRISDNEMKTERFISVIKEYLDLGQNEKALKTYRNALKFLNDSNGMWDYERYYIKLLFLFDYYNVDIFSEKIPIEFDFLSLYKDQVIVLQNLFKLKGDIRTLEPSEALEQLSLIGKKANNVHSFLSVFLDINIADLFMRLGDEKKAKEHYRKAFSYSVNTNFRVLYTYAAIRAGKNGCLDVLIDVVTKTELGYTKSYKCIEMALLSLADYYTRIGKNDDALKTMEFAISTYRKLHKKEDQAAFCFASAVVFDALEEQAKALAYYEQGFTLFKKLKWNSFEDIRDNMSIFSDRIIAKLKYLEKFQKQNVTLIDFIYDKTISKKAKYKDSIYLKNSIILNLAKMLYNMGQYEKSFIYCDEISVPHFKVNLFLYMFKQDHSFFNAIYLAKMSDTINNTDSAYRFEDKSKRLYMNAVYHSMLAELWVKLNLVEKAEESVGLVESYLNTIKYEKNEELKKKVIDVLGYLVTLYDALGNKTAAKNSLDEMFNALNDAKYDSLSNFAISNIFYSLNKIGDILNTTNDGKRTAKQWELSGPRYEILKNIR